MPSKGLEVLTTVTPAGRKAASEKHV